MARQPMPKSVSPLQVVQRSYTSELLESGVVFGVGVVGELLVSELVELVSKEGREPGVRRLPGLQRLRWLRNCCDIFSREL
jgi:hypothetical protein